VAQLWVLLCGHMAAIPTREASGCPVFATESMYSVETAWFQLLRLEKIVSTDW
jgi:hypothetical protein